jgi:hypothetical protein
MKSIGGGGRVITATIPSGEGGDFKTKAIRNDLFNESIDFELIRTVEGKSSAKRSMYEHVYIIIK